MLATVLLACIVATFAARRFSLDLAPPAAIAAAGLLGALLRAPWPSSATLRAALGGGLFIAMLALPFAGMLSPRPGSGVAAPIDAGCPWGAMTDWLAAERPAVGESDPAPILLAGDLFIGSEIAWRTPYRSVAAPHHRGGRAIADTVAVLDATDPGTARAILARRNVALLLTCVTTPVLRLHEGTLAAALRDGTVPDWLRPVPLPAALSAFRLHAVVPPR
jgi:hypothetical protein